MRDREFRPSNAMDDEHLERASSLGVEGMDELDDRLGSSSSAMGEANGGFKARFRRKGRSKSSSRTDDKPSRSLRYLDTASASLSSIPNRIQLSLLKSGLITISK